MLNMNKTNDLVMGLVQILIVNLEYWLTSSIDICTSL